MQYPYQSGEELIDIDEAMEKDVKTKQETRATIERYDHCSIVLIQGFY